MPRRWRDVAGEGKLGRRVIQATGKAAILFKAPIGQVRNNRIHDGEKDGIVILSGRGLIEQNEIFANK